MYKSSEVVLFMFEGVGYREIVAIFVSQGDVA